MNHLKTSELTLGSATEEVINRMSRKTRQKQKLKGYTYKDLVAEASSTGYKAVLARERLDALKAVRAELKKRRMPSAEDANNLEALQILLRKVRLNALDLVKAKLDKLGMPYDEESHDLDYLEILLQQEKESRAEAKRSVRRSIEKEATRREHILIKKGRQDTPLLTGQATGQILAPNTDSLTGERIDEFQDVNEMESQSFSFSDECQADGAATNSSTADVPGPPVSPVNAADVPVSEAVETQLKGDQKYIPDDELIRRAALRDRVEKRETTTTAYNRNSCVSELAKRRANGICQLCGNPAPFEDTQGVPYLESHHIEWLSKGGEDAIENTVALCPNCHRKMHILDLEADVKKLHEVVKLNEHLQ
jgi:5-methylcytosine-specific restriction endonuclease McrA